MLGSEDIKNVQVNTPTITDTTQVVTKPNEVVLPETIVKQKIADMFQINTFDIGKYEHDMNRIIDYVNKYNPQNLDDVVCYIKSLGAKLGNSPMEQQIKTISRYIYLTNQRETLDRDIERMTRQ